MAEQQSTTQRVRRRASRAAGPAKREPDATPDTEATELSEASEAAASGVSFVKVEAPAKETSSATSKAKKRAKPLTPLRPSPLRPPPRRPGHRALVAWISLAAAVLVIGLLSVGVVLLVGQHRQASAERARDQRFVDTASQTVVNMYSYTQDNIDESVNRFINGTSGQLRSKFGADNVAFLKQLYRKTNATSEAVVNGAALESIDTVNDTASVLVAVRVTVADVDGVNKPSEPYRLRIIVHQDEHGHMTASDMMYPNGGN